MRTFAFKSVLDFKYMAAPGNRKPVVAYVSLRRDRLRVTIHEKHLRNIPPEDGFTRPNVDGPYREITIRNAEHIRRAEPLLRAAYDGLTESQERGASTAQ